MPVIAARACGNQARYVVGEKGIASEPVFQIRMEDGGGTILISLRTHLPAMLGFEDKKAPHGEKNPLAEKLGEWIRERTLEAVAIEAVDRVVTLRWSGGLATRIEFMGRTPRIVIADGSGVRDVIAGGSPGGGAGGSGGRNARAWVGLVEGAPLPDVPGAEKPDLIAWPPEKWASAREGARSVPRWWLDEVGRATGSDDANRGADRWRKMAVELEAARAAGGPAWIAGEADRAELRVVERAGEAGGVNRGDSGSGASHRYESAMEAAAIWYAERSVSARLGARRTELLGRVKREAKKLRRAVSNLEQDLERAHRFPLLRKEAEILSIHFHAIEKGAREVTLPDPYGGDDVTIGLDPAKSARENIDRRFKKAAKGERAVPAIEERLETVRAKLGPLMEIAETAEKAKDEATIDDLAAQAEQYLPRPRPEPEWRKRIKSSKDQRATEGARPREYTVSGGYTVLVGRDNKENDRLTFKIAGQRDFWFHVSQSPGSHVVLLRDPKDDPPKEALLEAAAIAAWHSKARNASKVPVNYTERRFVRKPRGAPPGLVTIQREKTLFVEPKLPEKEE